MVCRGVIIQVKENKMNSDKITTVVGAIGAAAVGATPVLNAVQGSMHQQDYLSLLGAIAMAVLGYFTNKTKK